MVRRTTPRVEFTTADSRNLVQYIAVENPGVNNRTGNKLYQNLVNNTDKWPWAKRHTWQSWREHYRKNQDDFDRYIKTYQKKNKIKQSDKKKLIIRDISEEEEERPAQARSKRPRRTQDEEEEEEPVERAQKRRQVDKKVAVGEASGGTHDETARKEIPSGTSQNNKVRRADKGKEREVEAIPLPHDDNNDGPDQVLSQTAIASTSNMAPVAAKSSSQPPSEQPVNHESEIAAVSEPPEHSEGQDKPDETLMEVIAPAPSDDYSGGIFDKPSDSDESETSAEEADVTVQLTQNISQSADSEEAESLELDELDSTPAQRESTPQSQPQGEPLPDSSALDVTGPKIEPMSQQVPPYQPVSRPREDRSASQSLTDQPSTPPPYQNIYPDIASAPSPSLGSPVKPPGSVMPGTFTQPKDETLSQHVPPVVPKDEPASQQPPPSGPVFQASGVRQEPTPPLSGPDSSPPFTPSLLNTQARRLAGTNETAASTPRARYAARPLRRRRTRSRTPPLLVLSESDSDEDDEENMFTSLPPTPAVPRLKRQAPRLVEGPYSLAFTNRRGRAPFTPSGRRASGVDESEQESEEIDGYIVLTPTPKQDDNWPPKRGASFRYREPTRADKGKGRAHDVDERPHHPFTQVGPEQEDVQFRRVDKGKGKARAVDIPAEHHHPFSQVIPEDEEGEVRPRRAARARAYVEQILASALGAVQAPVHHAFTQPSQVDEDHYAGRARGNAAASSSRRDARKSVVNRFLTSLGEQAPCVSSAGAVAGSSRRSVPRTNSGEGSDAERGRDGTSWTTDDLSKARFHGSGHISPDRHPVREPEEASSPFTQIGVTSGRDDGDDTRAAKERRKTFAGFTHDAPVGYREPPRIRHSMPGRAARVPARPSIATTVELPPTPPQPSPARPGDRRLAMELGTEYLLDTMSKNHGFLKEIVYGIFDKVKDFQKTDMILKGMREAAEQNALAILEELGAGTSDTSSTGESENIHDAEPGDEEAEGSEAEEHVTPRGRPSVSHGRSSVLRWSPASGSREEYRPPRISRASEYARLVKEGREEEARKRERRRSTLGGVSPRKARKVRETHATDPMPQRTPEIEPLHLPTAPPHKPTPKKSNSAQSKSEVEHLLSDHKPPVKTGEGVLGRGQARKLTAALYSAYL